jgi:lipoyl(octanoyl) transferase
MSNAELRNSKFDIRYSIFVRPSHSPTWSVLLEPHGRPGAENMAVDDALLAEAGRTGGAFLRLYRFDPPCLSFGRNEPARVRYDREAIAGLGLDVVRRPTGGRAVWHAHEVTYAVAAPIAAFGRGSLRDSYIAIHARLAAALRALGVPATLASDRMTDGGSDGWTAGPCFATSVGGEILAGGRKLVGSAQVRHGTAFLQHGSILLAGSQDVITAVSLHKTAARRTFHVASAATTLSAVLGRRVTWEEVTQAILEVWGDNLTSTALHRLPPPSTALFDVTFTALHRPPPPSTARFTTALHRLPPPSTARFSDPAWTWRR